MKDYKGPSSNPKPTQTNATARPWMVIQGLPHTVPSDPPCVFAESGTLRVATIHGYLNQAPTNAALIVRAVNLHDAHEAVAEAAEQFIAGKSSGIILQKALAALNKLKEEL